MKPINEVLSLVDKTAIVTGGAMGIGLGIASRLAEAGANVVIADIDENEARKASEALTSKGFKVQAVEVNVASEQSVQSLIKKAISSFQSVDILVNNAGIYPNIPLVKLTTEEFERIIDINLKGVFLCTKYAVDQMIEQGAGGKIINITSIDALHPSMVGLATYDASKHGVWGFTKNTALELAQHKIWVNAIAPGAIATPGVAKLGEDGQPASSEEQKVMNEAFLANIPMHRIGEPDDIGKVALFLASDMASYMTGSQIVVDGGVLLS